MDPSDSESPPKSDLLAEIDRLRSLVKDLQNVCAEQTGQVKKNEEYYQLLFENAGLGIGFWSPDGELLSTNRIAKEHLGWDDESIHLGRSITDLFGAEQGRTYLARIQKIARSREVASFEDHLTLPGGARWFHSTYSAVVNPDGTVKGVEIVSQDITKHRQILEALRESEDKYRSLVENSNLGIALIGPGMKILAANRTLRKEFPRLDPARTDHCFEQFNSPPRTTTCKGCPVLQTLEDGRSHDGIVSIATDRGLRQCNCTSSPVVDEEGKVSSCIKTIEDVTDKLKIEKEMHEQEQMETVGCLAGGIAHDFNNILLAALGNLSLARMNIDSRSDAAEPLAEAEKALDRARGLTRQLLTFSSGGAPVKKIASLMEIIEETAGFVLHGSNVSYEIECADNLDFAEIDTGQISQVVTNLVINADQAMPTGGTVRLVVKNVTIDAQSALRLPPGRYIEMSVHDSGIGIPPKYEHRIFHPFFSTKKKGNGLGLTSCYSIVKKHGGHIRAESEPGKGSTFYVLLPASTKGPRDESAPPHRPFAGQGRILVMDDQESIRRLSRAMLEKLGYKAVMARNGTEAIDLWKEAAQVGEPFDAAILDLTVPGEMGGEKALKRLRAIDPHIKAVVSSGYSNDRVMADFEKSGFNARLEKPYRINELGRILHELLGGKQ